MVHLLLWISCFFVLATAFEPAFELVTQHSNGYLSFNPIAQQHLKSFASKRVAVVAVVGPYRSGKSYLLNQLIDLDGSSRSFSIANSVQPHTHGIFSYMYEPQMTSSSTEDEPEVIMFADTTGLFAPSNTEQADARIVALASLVSSVLIYNHLHVVDSQELNRFNFIVQYARGVPRMQEIGDWKDFQADLMWLVRDFFLELKDREQRDINATEWLFNALQESSSSDLRQMFRSVVAYTLPVPMRDRSHLLSLEDRPRDRTPAFKTALAHFRGKLLETVRSKRIGQQLMTGADLIQLLETCIDRLNSDRGIQSINTMETLVAAINEQVIQKALDRYERTLNGTEFPITETDLIQIHQQAVTEQMKRLKKELYALSLEQRDINAKTLKTRVKRTLQSFVNLNNVKCTNKVNQVIENEASAAFGAWNQTRFPLPDTEIRRQHAARREESERNFETHVVSKCLSKERNIASARHNLASRLESVLNDVIALNHRVADSICKEKTESWRVMIDSRLDRYNSLVDIELDFAIMKKELSSICIGPSSSTIESIDRVNRLDYVRDMIEQSRQRWKRTFFVLFIVCCLLGGFMVNTQDGRIAVAIALMVLSWLLAVLVHPIVSGFTTWDHVDAVFGNVTNFFSQILVVIGNNPGITALVMVITMPVGFFVYRRRLKAKPAGPYEQRHPHTNPKLERGVLKYGNRPDASFKYDGRGSLRQRRSPNRPNPYHM